MAQISNRLTQAKAAKLTAPGWYPDGQNLYLQVKSLTSKSWVFRYSVRRKEARLGLGSYPAVSIAKARDKAAELRSLLQDGIDLKAFRLEQRKQSERRESSSTFRSCAAAYIEAQSSSWSNLKHAQQWSNSLQTYAFPVLGGVDVSEITVDEVVSCLKPIWSTKTETAKRVRQRIEAIIDWSIIRGLRTDNNPARWKGFLDKILPPPNRVAPVKHHPYMAIEELPQFYSWLDRKRSVSSLCLQFLILTGVRQMEARGAIWSEINFEKAVWVLPRERKKERKPMTIPLSDRALQILETIKSYGSDFYVFSPAGQACISEAALRKLLKSYLEETQSQHCVLHGFRSCLRIWAETRTNYGFAVLEKLLAHTPGSHVQAAYLQNDFLEERRDILELWTKYLEREVDHEKS